ncbi:LADA_0H19482g1_1 [Lachancea dasiensis]|uniref:MICOS complex subunit n=1 Tax=Lachancea dasiensis TaxID=1072105 RepID=A0A1G4K6E5_9SACH|nr:LADA_0H19482g1_1 [Lachancea dasiensis]
MAPNFYRTVDPVSEAVIPPESGCVLSSEAREAAPSDDKHNSISHRATELIGDNNLLDGISVRSPVYLTRFFGMWRSSLCSTLGNVRDTVDEKSAKYYSHEKRLTTTIANLHSDPREDLLPGLTYSVVAAMSGSILARNRNILARLTAPLALGTICFSYVLPVTSSNSFSLLFDLEKQAFPEFTKKQLVFYDKCKTVLHSTVSATEASKNAVLGSFAKTTSFVREWTGLNV